MKVKVRVLGIVALALVAVAVWTTALERPAASGFLTLRAMDIGQGDALLLTTPLGHEVLIDAGPDDTVIDELDEALPPSDRTIDLAIASHNHSDHIGGMDAVLRQYPVHEFWWSGAVEASQTFETLQDLLSQQHVPTKAVHAGDSVRFDGVSLTVLFPLTSKANDDPTNQHDDMVVVLVDYGNRSMLLTGDLEDENEQKILDAGEITHPVDVLKVGHHGSETSTSEAWLNALRPSMAVISVGKKNKFGHPKPAVLDRLLAHRVQLFRTDVHGTVQVHTDGNRIWTETEK